MIYRSSLRFIAPLAVIALLAAACASDSDSGSPATAAPATAAPAVTTTAEPAEAEPVLESTTLKVGFSGQPDFTQVMNFKWLKDLKEKYGIDAEAVIFEGTSPPFRALVSGDIDMVVGQVPPGILLRQETGADVVMIGGDVQQSDYILVSTPEITSLEDLLGKQIGTAGPGSVSTSLTVAALKRENIDIDQIDFVEVGGTSARMAALVSGQTAAGAAHFAEGFNAVVAGLTPLYVIADSVGAYLFHGVWVDRSFITEKPVLAQLVMDEFFESVRWAANNKDEYIAEAADVTEGLAESAKSQAYDEFIRIGLFAVNGGLEASLIQATLDIEQEVENLPADVEDPSNWVVRTFVDSYLDRFGAQ
jgi:NitT/TauT family transport system substrate-binding protein